MGKEENGGERVENIVGKEEIADKRVENIVGKEENAGYQHFLFSLNVFKRFFTQGC